MINDGWILKCDRIITILIIMMIIIYRHQILNKSHFLFQVPQTLSKFRIYNIKRLKKKLYSKYIILHSPLAIDQHVS